WASRYGSSYSFPGSLLALSDLGNTQPVLPGEYLNVRDGEVHQQNGEGNALGHGAQEADGAGDDAQADAEDQLALPGGGRGDIVGGHEKGPQHQSAREQLHDGVMAGDQAEHRYGGQVGHRDDR